MIGHNFIINEIGEESLPKIGWDLDAFGHSQTVPKLMSEIGYNGFFLEEMI